MKKLTSNRALHAAVNIYCLLIAPALVQAAEPAADNAGLEEIVVTATKRAESVQVVPLTVDVVSQAALDAQNLTSTADLKRLVPGLEYRHAGTPGNDAFNIRGIETLATAYGLEQSVGVAFDGVPLARAVGSIADLVDVHSVEVLEGPQGMLFGKNASAGLINIVTNSPELGKTNTLLRASFGSLNARQYSGTVNLPVTDDSAVRFSAWKFTHDGVARDATNGQEFGDQNTSGARLKYRWQATDQLSVNFTGEWDSHDQNAPDYTFRTFYPQNFTSGNAGALVQSWELAHGTTPSDHNRTERSIGTPYYDKGHTDAYTVQADYAVGEGTVTGIASYRDIHSADSTNPFPSDNPYSQQFLNTDFVDYVQSSEEIRYVSPVADRLHYVVGLFNYRLNLSDTNGFGVSQEIVPGTPAIVLLDTEFHEGLRNENYAAFGEATFDVTKEFHVIAGIRRSTEKLDVSMHRYGPNTSFFGPFETGTTTTYDDVSYRFGLQYEFLPDAMLYATASRGYKGPGIGYQLSTTASDLAATNNGVVKPEIVHAYETGLKSQWFDRRLTFNAAVFYEIFGDFQTSILVPSFPQPIVAIENAGQARTSGLDLTSSWAITPSFSVLANAVYTDARYTDYNNAGCYPAQTAADGCRPNGTQSLNGVRLSDVPKTSANLTARYQHPITDQFRGFVQVNGNYRSHVSFSSSNDKYAQQGGYTVANLTMGVDTADGRWGISVYGNNLFDKHYVDFIVSNGSSNAWTLNDIGYQDLQTFGVTVTARF